MTTKLSHGALNTGAEGGFRNKLRNGNFLSWTKGTSSISIGAAATGVAAISASGWAVLATGSTVVASRVTVSQSNCLYALKVLGNTGVTDVTIAQRIDGLESAALAGQTITFQAWVFNNTGGTITPTIALRYTSAFNDWTTPVADLAATNLQACGNNAWTLISYSYTVSSNAGVYNGYEVKIDFGNNFSTNAKFVEITAADLSVTSGGTTGINNSPVAAEFPHAATELRRNMRYLQASYLNGVIPGTATHVGMVGGHPVLNATYGGAQRIQFMNEMRATPSMQWWDGAGASNATSFTVSGFSFTDGVAQSVVGSATPDAKGFHIGYGAGAVTSAYYFQHYLAYADFW